MAENYHGRQRAQTRDGKLRAGDSDREAVAEVLRQQHLTGRLDTDEFQERIDRCYAAKTFAELDELVADLPPEDLPREKRTRRPDRPWRRPSLAVLPVLAALIVVSQGHLLWLALPLAFFVARPVYWHRAGRRPGWDRSGCRARYGAPRGSYL